MHALRGVFLSPKAAGGGDNVMARQRSPKRDTAHTVWQNANGNITLKEIANQLDWLSALLRLKNNVQ